MNKPKKKEQDVNTQAADIVARTTGQPKPTGVFAALLARRLAVKKKKGRG